MARSNRLIKIVVALGVLIGLGFIFVRSVINTRAEPYTVRSEHLRNWTLAVQTGESPTQPMLVLLPQAELASDLFRQVFARSGESMSGPAVAAIPLVLQDEFDRAFAGRVTAGELLTAARDAGLESTPPEMRCLAYRRVSAPGLTRQVYFVVFEAPAFEQFRTRIAGLAREANSPGPFDPAALSPVLLIASTDRAFNSWLPLRAAPDADCIAPITAGPS
jgi:hypothetical protein